MKTINTLMLIASIFFSTTLPIELTPDNTELIFDLDDIVIEPMGYGIHQTKIVLSGIAQDPLNAVEYINALRDLKKSYAKDEHGNKGIYDKYGNKVSGLTAQFLFHGMRDQRLTPYVAGIVETMENSRWFIDDTKKTIDYLKEKGDNINFATNKDRISYDLTAQAFGNELTSIPKKVFVAHPGNNDVVLAQLEEFANLPTTPTIYKELEHKNRTIQPTEKIFHAPGKKPQDETFDFITKTVGTNKHQIFFDDKKENVNAFNKQQNNSSALRHGVHINKKKRTKGQIAEELVKIGYLSEIEDKKFLDSIRGL